LAPQDAPLLRELLGEFLDLPGLEQPALAGHVLPQHEAGLHAHPAVRDAL
jgi:hypothetical protein